MSKPKLTINPLEYPNDRNIHDLILAKSFSSAMIRKFLSARGIFPHNRDRSGLSRLVARHVHSFEDITELVGYANLPVHRPKTIVNQMSIKGVSLDDIALFFQNEFRFSGDDYDTRISNQQRNPIVNEQEKNLIFTQPFTKVDFKKTALLQETEHEFTVTFQEKDEGGFEIIYSTTAPESAKYFQQIKQGIEQKGGEDTYIHEIDQAELSVELSNEFFDKLLAINIDGFEVESVESVRLKLTDGSNVDLVEPEGEADYDDDETDDGNPKIKELNVHGKSVIKHPDIVRYREAGYYVVSISASLEKTGEGEQKSIKFRAGFSKVGKFETEILSETSHLFDEHGKKSSTGLPLTKIRRENLSRQIHEKAFDAFEECRNKPDAGVGR